MVYKMLGGSGLRLSAIAYGSFGIGSTMVSGTGKKEAIEAIRASLDHGITTIDTSPFYGLGLSEQIIGEAIKGKDRSSIQILLKLELVCNYGNHHQGELFFKVENGGKKYSIFRHASKVSIIREVENSLLRLGIEYIDLLQIPYINSVNTGEHIHILKQLVGQGKIRAIGVSNFSADQMHEIQQFTALASNQVAFSMVNRSIETSVVPYAVANDIGIITHSSLERGLLTGKYFRGSRLIASDHRNEYYHQFDLVKVKNFLSKLDSIARSKGATLSQLVLKWTTLQPGISVVLAGARDATQAVNNARAINFTISSEELDFINIILMALAPSTTSIAS